MGNGASLPDSEVAKKYGNLYAKEALRTVKDGVRETTRSVRQGVELTKAVYRKFDVTGNKRKKATELAREERRKKLLEKRKKDGSDDEDEEGEGGYQPKEAVQELKVVAAENDPEDDDGQNLGEAAVRLPTLAKEEEQLGFLGLNVATGGGGSKPKSKTTPAAKVASNIKKLKAQGRKLRQALVDRLGDQKLLPGAQEVKGYDEEIAANQSIEGGVAKTGNVLAVAAKFKRKLGKKHEEEDKDSYHLVDEKDETLDKYGGTDVLGWNRSPMHAVRWTQVVLYIIRAHGDCSEEVELIFSQVLPRVRAALLPAAIFVQLRDLGGVEEDAIFSENPSEEQRVRLPPISAGFKTLKEPGAIRIILLGTKYGPSWKATAGDPWDGEEVPEGFDVEDAELSELDLIATEAGKNSEMKHKVFKKWATCPRTLLYTCVDPEAQVELEGGESSSLQTGASKNKQAAGRGSVAGRSTTNSRATAASVPASRVSATQSATMVSTNPIVVAKMQKKEAKRAKKAQLAKLNKLVFNALVRDEVTGKPRDPLEIFKKLDEDGSGTVTKSEFNSGLKTCGLVLDVPNLDLLWSSLDDDGGGDLDYQELCQKLEGQYKKVLEAEQKHLRFMPRLLASKLEPLMPPNTTRARLDTMRDFQDTAERQRKRWLTRFTDDLTADLKRILPILAMAAIEVEEAGEKLVSGETIADRATMPLNFLPEVPEYLEHTDAVLRHGRGTAAVGGLGSNRGSFKDSFKGRRGDDSFQSRGGRSDISGSFVNRHAGKDGFWDTEGGMRVAMSLLDYAKGIVSWPCALVGDRGSGRTHVIRELVLGLRKERPMDHIVVHTVGNSPDSSELSCMLWHLCLELGRRFDLEDEVLATDPSTVLEYFPRLLLKLTIESGVMLFLVIDGIEKLHSDGQDLDGDVEWFPAATPVQVRIVVSCSDGKTLNALRRKKARFDGQAELVEIRMPMHGESLKRKARGQGNDGGMSDSSGDDDHRRGGWDDQGSNADTSVYEDGVEESYDRAVVHVLSQSRMFKRTGIQAMYESSTNAVMDAIIRQAEEVNSADAVHRYFLLVMNSREGILEQDLYEMLNANAQDGSMGLPFLRLSYQQFVHLRDTLDPIIGRITFGGQAMRWMCQSAFMENLQALFEWQEFYVEIHTLMAQHYLQQLSFVTDPSSRWYGENNRAVSEILFHLSQAMLSDRVLEVASSLRYIEARCTLGLHQAAGLYLDYRLLLNRSQCAHDWIKTDLIAVQDCFTMVRRYSHIFVKYPRWVFSIAASLPDSTGPAIIAKSNWSAKKETRPQLAWLNKPQVVNPCILKVEDRGVVLHSASFSRDMTKLVGVGQDSMVFVWRLPEGELISKLPGHLDHVMSVQISIDDMHIITGSRDGNVIVWKMPMVEEYELRVRQHEEQERLERLAREAEGEFSSEEEEDEELEATQGERPGSASSGKEEEKEQGGDREQNLLTIDDAGNEMEHKNEGSGEKEGGKDDEVEGAKDTSQSQRPTTQGSKRSVQFQQPFKKRKNKPQKAQPDLLLDPNKMLSLIPAHKSTVWSVAFSTCFEHRCQLQIPVGTRKHLGAVVIDYDLFDGLFARLGSTLDDKIVFPLSVASDVVISRALTEDEKKTLRLKAKAAADARAATEKSAQAASKDTVNISASEKQSSKKSNFPKGKEKKASRREKIAANLQQWEAAEQEDFEAREAERAAKEALDAGPVPDFEHQASMKGKIVVFHLDDEEEPGVVDQDNLEFAVRSFYEAGAAAVVLISAHEKAPVIAMETTDLALPVVTVGCNTGDTLKDDDGIIIKRMLEPGRYCASTSSDRTVKVWDTFKAVQGHTLARRPIAVLEGHSSYVTHCCFNPYGDTLASSAGDNAVILWDMNTMKKTTAYEACMAPVMQSSWSADGTKILSVSHDGWFRLWRVFDGMTLKESQGPHKGHLWACAYSEDQKYMATGGHDGRIVIWDVELMLSRNKELMVLEGHEGPIFSLVFSPDGNRVVSCASDRSARVWATDHDLDHYSLHREQQKIEFKIAESKKKVELKELLEKSRSGWANAGGARIDWERQGHPTTIHCLCFSPDGSNLATAGADGEVLLWSVTGENVRKKLLGHAAAVFVCTYSNDGLYFASGDSAGEILIWDPSSGRKLFTFPGHTDRVCSLHFNPRSTRLISSSSDSTMRLWRLDDPFDNMAKSTGLVIYEDEEDLREPFPVNTTLPEVPPIKGLGSISGSREGSVAASKASKQLSKHGSVAGSKQGSQEASNGSRKSKVLETSGGGLVMQPGKKGKESMENKPRFKAYDEQRSALLQVLEMSRIAYCCKFSSNGKLMAVASADSVVHIYHYTDDEIQEELVEMGLMPRLGMDSPDKHRSYVKHILWDNDSKRMATSGVDGTIKLWSARNGMLLRNFVGHEKEVWQITFSPDNKTILSCSLDNTARMWNTGSGDELFRISHLDTIHWGAFMHDGRRFATCSHDGVFKVWEKDDKKHVKKASRGWPRVRELLPKIARMRAVPCALSLDGRICCYALPRAHGSELSQTITVGHTVHGKELYRFKLLVPVDMAAVSADGETVVFCYGMVMRVFVRGELSCEVRKAHRAAIVEVRFSEDDAFLATGGDDTVAKVWRIDDDGQLILVKRLRGHISSVKATCFSPNGKILASGGADLCVKLWSTSSWKNLVTVKAHDNFVTVVAFDAPGLKFLSAGDDQTVRVWHLPRKPTPRNPPKEILRIQDLQSSVIAADFSEDGSRVVGVLAGKQIFVWHATTGTALVWWQFSPFDTTLFADSLWRTGQLALNDHLNAAIVTDSAGNTLTFALLGITAADAEKH